MSVVEEIAWGDGSGDKIYLTADALEGNQTVLVSSDANARAPRTKVITFSASGATPVTLTVSQDGGTGTEHTVTFNPSSYDTTDYSYDSVSNISRAYGSASSTNYARIYLTKGSRAETWIYFQFDTSSIPADAVINSVSCKVKCAIDTTNTSVVATRTLRLYSGTTSKGDSATFTNSTSTAVELSSNSTWTRAEAGDIRIRAYVKRGTSQASTAHYFDFYGATLTVKYTTYD